MKIKIFSSQAILAVFFLILPILSLAGTPAPFNPGGDANLDNLMLVRADVFSTIASIINYALSFLGIIALVLIIYAGAIWMLARGNEEQIKKAQEIMKGAFIGLVIILSAYAISYFVFSELVSIVSNTALP